MNIEVSTRPPLAIVTISGKVHLSTAQSFDERLQTLLEDESLNRLILDFSNVDYISSVGLRSVLQAGKMMKTRSGSMALATTQEFTQQIFEDAGFSMLFSITDTVEEAEKALEA